MRMLMITWKSKDGVLISTLGHLINETQTEFNICSDVSNMEIFRQIRINKLDVVDVTVLITHVPVSRTVN